MNPFRWFWSISSSPVARRRLDMLLAYERRSIANKDVMALLREDVIALVRRHTDVKPGKVEMTMNPGALAYRLTIDIEIPVRLRPVAVRS